MKTEKDILLRVLNNVMLNATNLIDQVLNYDTEIKDKDISDVKQACELLRGLDILEELPF